jgi:transposase
MSGEHEDPIVEALREIRATQDAHGRDLRLLQASHASLIRELCDELAHLRSEMATELAEVRSLVRAASVDRAARTSSAPRPTGTASGA